MSGQLVLSEFCAGNSSLLLDEDGDAEDWIEVANPGLERIELTGWSLTDDVAGPRKWVFPSTNLAPGGFMVVFASNKDRRSPGAPLHTNFRLANTGEYLALVAPDGATIATQFSPAYPPQATDTSYGLPRTPDLTSLIAAGASCRWRVPVDGSLDSTWFLPGAGDTSWSLGPNTIGFGSDFAGARANDVAAEMRGINSSILVRLPFTVTNLEQLETLRLKTRYNDGFVAYLNGTLVAVCNGPYEATGGMLADSSVDWGGGGQQGFNNWYYGFYDRSKDADQIYDPQSDFDSLDPNWTWNGGAWVLGPSNPPWDLISASGWHPNGVNNGSEHWVVRRWVSETGGFVKCAFSFAKENTACGSGTTLRVLHNGEERFAWTVPYNDAEGVVTNVVLWGLQPGDFLDFALDPLGTDGSSDDSCDGSTFAVTIEQDSSEGPQWNSTATAVRSTAESLQVDEIDLTRYAGLLAEGKNVLALQGLNSSKDDANFLLVPELEAVYSGMDPTVHGYFLVPTPGAPNGAASEDLGPLISEVRHLPNVPADEQDLLVTARVLASLRPVASVSMAYRVMYGAQMTLPMVDDGAHGDGVAGDSVYGAWIPAGVSKPAQMVRYLVTATDTGGKSSKAPTYDDPLNSPQYFGTVVAEPALTNSRLPVLHWFIQNASAADSDATARSSVFFKGEFYDNIGVNIHGQSTRGFPKKSYDFDFNPGNRFRWSEDAPRVGDFNLLTTWADKTHMRSVLAHETYRDSGAPAHYAFAVRVQRNGAFFSVANLVENGDEDFLQRLGYDENGALYKMYNSAESVDLAEKKTRRFEGMADLQALITGMRQPTVAARQAFMYDNLDLPDMVNFLAAKMITADTDCCHKNYYLYRDSEGTLEWQAMPWDVDLSFGRVWTCGSSCLSYFDETIYTNQSVTVGYQNIVFTPIYDTVATRQMYFRRLRTLLDQLLQAPETPITSDFYRNKTAALRDQIAPDAVLDLAKWGTWGTRETITQAVNRIWNEFLPGRRGYMFRTLSVTNRGEIPMSQPTNAAVQFAGLEYRSTMAKPLEEWLALTNANTYAVDISDWRLDGAVRFTFKPGTVIPARSGLFVSPDVRAFRNRTTTPRGGERRLIVGPYAGDLSAWGESLAIIDATGRLVATNSYVGDPSAAQRFLRITEIFYHPDLLASQPGLDAQAYEFIELQNTGTNSLDLRGVKFTQGVLFDFSSGSIQQLAPGERVLLARDANAFALRYGAGLPLAGQYAGSLDNGGERLRLEDSCGEKILDFAYDDDWYPITDGHGFSLVIADASLPWSVWGEKTSWRVNGWAGGTPGGSDSALGVAGGVVINEVLAHTDPPQVDAIELWNAGGSAVNVGDWYLTDDFDVPRKYRIPAGTSIAAGGYLSFNEAHFNAAPGAPASFVLNSEGDDVWLFSADAAGNLTGYVDGFEFGATANGVSLGRHVNSAGTLDHPAEKALTLGSQNAGPLVGPVVISEIMYHPGSGASNLELQNITATNMPLFTPGEETNTWRIRSAVSFDFPQGVTLAAGARVLVVGFDPLTDATALGQFRTLYQVAVSVPVFGPWQGGLDNSADTVELLKPDPWGTNGVPYVLVDKVAYRDAAPWPVEADGTGASLQRLLVSSYGNEPTNWVASPPSAGKANQVSMRPVVRMTAPVNGARFHVATAIALSADASDADGRIARVQFKADGLVVAEDVTAPYGVTWTNLPTGSHVLTAMAEDDAGGTSESAAVTITVLPPAPIVSLVSPTNGTVALAGTGVELRAAVTLSGAVIDQVGFYLDGQLFTEVFAAPYRLTWQTSLTGARRVTAVATDVWGSSGTSVVATVAFTSGTNAPMTLVSSNSVWKYLDNGSDPGTAWEQRTFNDAGWASGPAELGYGDTSEGWPEATVLSYGPDAANKPMTCYFRRAFVVESASTVTQLRLRLLRDDGAVVYLNGKPVLTNNMPSGVIGFATPALNTVSGAEEATFYEFGVDASALVEGTNVVAVEVHQSSTSSSDLSFDLALEGTRTLLSPVILRSPVSTNVAVGRAVRLAVWAGGSEPLSYRWLKDGVTIAGATAESYGIASAEVSDAGRYSVVVSNAMGSAVSAAAVLGIMNDTNGPSAGSLMIAKEGGAVRLQYRATVGGNCELQKSTDLIGWNKVTSAAVTANGVVEWVESLPVAGAAYYRVRE